MKADDSAIFVQWNINGINDTATAIAVTVFPDKHYKILYAILPGNGGAHHQAGEPDVCNSTPSTLSYLTFL
ncbi:14291_t:CDS:2 [Funneliformis geosporum]|uniref:3272_t:CDS:1 n=1 Tax=Funneliformis geosporum TaxID=1117311 RepID=A0A9W4WLD2_9GLOM|nr:14291_t:CDS:2 [Funneliformis geosporum]CAI2170612.1 3272_t:CDS:2 [Funneliformis geosporum]